MRQDRLLRLLAQPPRVPARPRGRTPHPALRRAGGGLVVVRHRRAGLRPAPVVSAPAAWPELDYASWRDTKQTLHRFAQIVGKLRMSLVPPQNHWWHVTLRLSVHGLTTGPMPHGGETVEVELDFVEHRVQVRTS